MDTKAVGKRIGLFRERAGLTQATLAEKIDCNPQRASSMERAAKTPTFGTFVVIGNVLQAQMKILPQDVLG